MKKIQLAVVINSVSTLSDGSFKISVGTPEMSDEEGAVLLSFRKKQGYMLFSETSVSEKDLEVPEVETEFPQDKSPSQRLRNALYVLWETKTDKSKPFETLYREQMEKIINKVKDKLN